MSRDSRSSSESLWSPWPSDSQVQLHRLPARSRPRLPLSSTRMKPQHARRTRLHFPQSRLLARPSSLRMPVGASPARSSRGAGVPIKGTRVSLVILAAISPSLTPSVSANAEGASRAGCVRPGTIPQILGRFRWREETETSKFMDWLTVFVQQPVKLCRAAGQII